MKCPKCDYISFDHLTSCKKCGFVFKKSSSSETLVSFKSPISDSKTGGEEIDQAKRPPDVSKTVASIQASLNEIEADEHEDNKNSSKEKSDKIEFDGVQHQNSDTSVEESKKFPTFDEIDWKESVSLSSDKLNLDSGDLAGEEGEKKEEIRFEDEKPGVSDEKTEKLREELERMGKELKQIEEEPEKSKPEYPSEHPDASFDLSTVRKGGFWIRFIAITIDNIILNILSFILIFIGLIALGLGPSGFEELEGERIFSFLVPFYIFNIIITIAYYTYFHGSTGQTPGKMICRLKVVCLNGEPLGYGKAFLRWIGYIISSFIFCLGFLWAAWDKNKQAWHDKIVGTYVIRI